MASYRGHAIIELSNRRYTVSLALLFLTTDEVRVSYERTGGINKEGFRLDVRVRHDKRVSKRDSVRKNIYECSYHSCGWHSYANEVS